MAEENWERKTLERLASDIVVERRRSRRWSIFFRLAGFAMLLVLALTLVALLGVGQKVCLKECTAVVHVEGEIDRNGRANAETLITGLKQAYEYPQVKGIVVVINSPGGSPVQAGLVYDELLRLRAKHPNKPTFAVVEELAASGGYYIAAGAERIYVDRASIVGSIGVIMQSFGLVEAIDKLGVERRVITAGENKSFLDPFLPLEPRHVEHIRTMLIEVHQQFVDAVRKGRGDRLKDTPDLYSGLVWTGSRAVELGLADAIGSVDYVAREVIKAEEVVDFTPEEGLSERIARRFGTTLARWFGYQLKVPRFAGYSLR
ncbi:MAG TPA: S49 family peptidase [Casimicrobiaceae bacterium]|nr:S49 family peptidase [Casimicrobiaceae bacterium]